jgi:hypothetical protein
MKSNKVKLIIAVLLFLFAVLIGCVKAEELSSENYIPLTVIGNNLNCRMSANKHSYVVTELEKGQGILSTGRWSKDHKWVEIEHPEHGKLWCSYQYLTERTDPFKVETLWDEPLKIRKQPFNGRVSGYLRKGKEIEITQVILGWGKCKQGWIDLDYCIEIEEE